jgi:hypothetical protein
MKTKSKSSQRSVAGPKAAGSSEALDYEARVAPEKHAARQESIANFIDHVKKSMAATVSSVELGKESINQMRQAGIAWLVASDKKQFYLPFFDQVDALLTDADRKFCSPALVKTAIELARALPSPVTSAAAAAEHIQKPLFAFEMLAKPWRQPVAKALAVNWGEMIPVEIGKVNLFLRDLLAAEPKDTWSRDRWETIEAQTEFCAQLNREAKSKCK